MPSAADVLRAKVLEIAARKKAEAAQAALREQQASSKQSQNTGVVFAPMPPSSEVEQGEVLGAAEFQIKGIKYTLNEDQMAAVGYASAGKEFCLIGAAGTGKTTTVKKIIVELMKLVPKDSVQDSIALVSFTNRAVRNMAKAVQDVEGTTGICQTIHYLLKFAPEYETYYTSDGEEKRTMRFVPTYTALNPLLAMKLVVVEESSMVSTQLFKMLKDACPNAKFIFLGDLNQLPPVFGDAILGFKLLELPVVELTKVYRQAMESPIIGFQHKFTLAGKRPTDGQLLEYNEKPGIYFHTIKQSVGNPEMMCHIFGKFFRKHYEEKKYMPGEDIILIPYNKGFGTKGLNKEIAQFLGEMAGAEIVEVIAGPQKHYLAVGDFMIFNRMEWRIKAIKKNSQYIGVAPKMPSTEMNRDGSYRHGAKIKDLFDEAPVEDMAPIEVDFEKLDEIENAASHIITLSPAFDNPMPETDIKARGDINGMDFGYAITIHKSQGSEWRKVYLIMSDAHGAMLNRELLYTGMTRAKEELYMFFSPQSATGSRDSSVARSIKVQAIKGNTWQAKVEYFKGKYDNHKAHMDGNQFEELDNVQYN